jgi:hypothetical protein
MTLSKRVLFIRFSCSQCLNASVEVGFNGKGVAGGIPGRFVSCDESGKMYLGGVAGALIT